MIKRDYPRQLFLRMKRWLDKSIANRIVLSMLLLTLAITLVLGLLSYLFTSNQINNSINEQLNSQNLLVKQRVELRLQVLSESLEGLASNSLIANGLVDSSGRKAYLTPFLQDFRAPIPKLQIEIDLVDFQGQTIISNHEVSATGFGGNTWFATALQQSNKYARIDIQDKVATLLMAFPVIYPATGQAEGMLIMRLPLQAFFAERATLAMNDVDVLALTNDRAEPIAALGEAIEQEMLTTTQAITLSAPLDQLGLKIVAGKSRAVALAPLTNLALGYAMIGFLTMVVALFIAKFIVRRLVHRVSQLSEAANNISEHGMTDVTLPATGDDEVGTLGKALTRMLGALQASRDNLESLVKTRTNALAESENRLQTIMDSVQEAIITFGSDGRILSFNRGAEQMFACSRASQMDKPLASLLADQLDVSMLLAKRDAECSDYGSITLSLNAMRSDNGIFPAELVIGRMKQGELNAFVVAIRDLTERHKVDQMKNEFVSIVSHELRTPLTAIRGSLGLLAGNVVGEMPAAQKSLVDMSLRNAERLIALVNDILDMEKIATGKMVFDFQPHDLGDLMEQAVEGLRAYGSQYDVSYQLIAPAECAKVNVDSARFTQIMANLLSNAAKFSPAHSSVEVGWHSSEKDVHIFVTDHGQGIPAEFQGKIFQKFSQAEEVNTRSKGGSGLGLSITKELVSKMGGSIWYETAAGTGTTFHLTFPQAQERQNAL